MNLRHTIFVLKEKLGIFLWGIIQADKGSKAAFLLTSLRHLLKYSILSGMAPKKLAVKLKGTIYYFKEFTGEIGMYKEIYINDIYGSVPSFKVENANGLVIFDIGSNIGLYTLKAANTCKSCKVYSFEPNPEVFSRLKKNIELNRLDNVRLFNIGFADKKGKAYLNSGDSTVFGKVSYEGGRFQIDIDTLDSFTVKEGVNKIDIMKIDAEDFELNVLKGADKTLDMTDNIVMECNKSLEPEVTELLRAKGFELALKIPDYGIVYFVRSK